MFTEEIGLHELWPEVCGNAGRCRAVGKIQGDVDGVVEAVEAIWS